MDPEELEDVAVDLMGNVQASLFGTCPLFYFQFHVVHLIFSSTLSSYFFNSFFLSFSFKSNTLRQQPTRWQSVLQQHRQYARHTTPEEIDPSRLWAGTFRWTSFWLLFSYRVSSFLSTSILNVYGLLFPPPPSSSSKVLSRRGNHDDDNNVLLLILFSRHTFVLIFWFLIWFGYGR